MARRDASASSQVEIEDAATQREALEDELRRMKKRAADATADARQQIAALEAKLASSAGKTNPAGGLHERPRRATSTPGRDCSVVAVALAY